MSDVVSTVGRNLVLGLDLGVRSVGWALLEYEGDDPIGIRASGVRIFEAGVEGDIEQGKEESRAVARRMARLQRRQFFRRAQRDRRVISALQQHGLMPSGPVRNSVFRHETILALDKAIYEKFAMEVPESDRHRLANTLPYWLRARAATQSLELFEIGRAFYHLAQRRGFLSNRRGAGKNEEKSTVYQGIGELRNAMESTGSKTLGTFFAKLNPTSIDSKRIRSRWTHRDMYAREFELIWIEQAKHRPELFNKAFKKQLRRAIFDQRPLRSAKHLVGECPFETEATCPKGAQKRAPLHLDIAQQVRTWQTLNHLRIVFPDHEEVQLTLEERQMLFAILDREGDMTFAAAKKLLKDSRGSKFKFTLEEGGETRIPGNRVNGRLREVFGDRLDTFTAEERAQVLQDIRCFEKAEALERRGRKRWGLDPETAKKFSQIEFEDGYAALSRMAMEKILPHLEAGFSYREACDLAYPKSEEGQSGKHVTIMGLPPITQAPLGALRNPAVTRVLCQLRKVINALIRTYGKPDIVRIELARDLALPRDKRQKLSKSNRERQGQRTEAKEEIGEKSGDMNPRRGDVERVLLAKECNWTCPYTGKHFGMAELMGAQYDIEHIIPYSLCLDNSFANKTLCYHEVNRTEKGNKTPWQAFGADKARYEAMIDRVRCFSGHHARRKLERFLMDDEGLEEFLGKFTASQLNDTRYASKLASKYCALLYPGTEQHKHVKASKGGITAELRRAWQMNKILGGGEKSRDDHRHHAVDAIAVALTTPRIIKRISDAARKSELAHERFWKHLPMPWEGFLDDCIKSIEQITVSHAVMGRVRGPLHKGTHYSPPKADPEGKGDFVHVRKPIAALSKSEVEAIVDDTIREIIKKALGNGDPGKVFKPVEDHPFLMTKDGQKVPIHRVRIKKREPVFKVGENERARYVTSGANHHIEIFACKDKKGNEYWDAEVVSLFEAIRRKGKGEPIVRREREGFLFSLLNGDSIRMQGSDGDSKLFVVRGFSAFSSGQIVIDFLTQCDARPISKVPRQGRTRGPDTLRKSAGKKVKIDPLGNVLPAND